MAPQAGLVRLLVDVAGIYSTFLLWALLQVSIESLGRV
jgi:hypothetical protein